MTNTQLLQELNKRIEEAQRNACATEVAAKMSYSYARALNSKVLECDEDTDDALETMQHKADRAQLLAIELTSVLASLKAIADHLNPTSIE